MDADSKESKLVKLYCPSCGVKQEAFVPASLFENINTTGIVTISMKCCGKSCHVFVDKHLKMRGGQCADVDAEPHNVVPVPEQSLFVAEVVLQLAKEIIKMNADDWDFARGIGAEDKISLIERALVTGDLPSALENINYLREFAIEIGESDYATRLSAKAAKVQNLLETKKDFNWELGNLKQVEDEMHLKALREHRIQKIIAGLEFEAIEGRLPREILERKRAGLTTLFS